MSEKKTIEVGRDDLRTGDRLTFKPSFAIKNGEAADEPITATVVVTSAGSAYAAGYCLAAGQIGEFQHLLEFISATREVPVHELRDNIITGVVYEDRDETSDAPEAFSLQVFSAHKKDHAGEHRRRLYERLLLPFRKHGREEKGTVMSEYMEHKSEALAALVAAQGVTIPDSAALVEMVYAQTHATLALAEQQRIANLITLLNTENGPDRVLSKSGDWGDICAEVVSALGIGDDDE